MKDSGEQWGTKVKVRVGARLGGLQCPDEESLILRVTGIHSVEVVMQSDLHWKISLVALHRGWVREGHEWRPGSRLRR